jgi:hypothetical protein
MVIFGLYLYNSDFIFVSDDLKFWSLLHLILHAFPIFIYICNYSNRNTNFPFIEILAAFNIIYFGLPVFFIKVSDFQLGALNVAALRETVMAFLIFYTSYFYFKRHLFLKPIEFVSPGSSILLLKLYSYFFLLIFIISKFVSESTLFHLGNTGIYIYIGFMIKFWRERNLKFFEKLCFSSILFVEILNRAVGGLLAPLALLFFFISLCIIISKSNKSILILGLVSFGLFYGAFTSIKTDYRRKVWFSGKDYTLIEKLQLISDLYNSHEQSKSFIAEDEYNGKEHMLWRYSYQLSAMSMVMEKTPTYVPYWNGSSYLPLVTKFVPRFLWPDKPQENMGYEFGVKYNVISASNKTTSINTPIIPELYMNFGSLGVYIGCFVLGLIFHTLSCLYNSINVSFESKIVGMSVIFPLVIWESNFSLIFGNLLLITIILVYTYRLLRVFVR